MPAGKDHDGRQVMWEHGVLRFVKGNEKALLRRGLAFEACEKFRSALADIRQLLLINPNIPMAKSAQNRIGNAT